MPSHNERVRDCNLVKNTNTGVAIGELDHWKREVDIYKAATKNLRNNQKTIFLHSLGSGHDWIGEVEIDEAERYIGVPR